MKNKITNFSIPRELHIQQRMMSWTTTFDILTDGCIIGNVHRKFSLFHEYDFYDANNNLEAKAKARFSSFITTFDVTDCDERLIGIINERFFCFFPTFEILSPEGLVLLIAKINFWGTKYSLTDPVTNQEVAIMTRDFWRLKNNWKVTIIDTNFFSEKQISPYLMITLAAYQSDSEWKRSKGGRRK